MDNFELKDQFDSLDIHKEETEMERNIDQNSIEPEDSDQNDAPQEENKGEEEDPELLDKESVSIFFNQIGISDYTKTILIENGFDNFESLSYLSKDVLSQLKIKNNTDIDSLLNSLSSIAECYRNSASMKEALGAYEKCIPGTVITPKLLMKCATNIKQKRKDHKGRLIAEHFLPGITHLSLESRNITKIESLDMCTNLKNLYLYENKISKIQGLENCVNLTILSLERNLISKIEGLENLKKLQKLYLENNCINRLEGLHSNSNLEEINLNNQNLSPGQEFTFDDLSLCAVCSSLVRLDLKSCQIVDPKPLFYLERLDVLNLKDNQISELEAVSPFLSTIRYLRVLDMRGNPLAKIRKYRDQIIMIGLSIQTLDDKKVTEHERQYLLTLEMKKKGIKVPTKEPQFEMAGQGGYGGRGGRWFRGRGGFGQPTGGRKTVQKLPKGKKMTNLGDRPPIKAGLSIVGNEMEIMHPLDEKENQLEQPGSKESTHFQPPDQYPTYEELMKMASLPSRVEISKK
ncbi:unnamed protein product [Moneuplotes crassus]|uniref:Protein phosphatase 1 regulatory subunit 7 n=2 Tax=Euplotes crassus TaxID=5936 RepID=A0AAD1X9D1_EUPCR|nr:unnamed protein product [Moneuplotes crassus]